MRTRRLHLAMILAIVLAVAACGSPGQGSTGSATATGGAARPTMPPSVDGWSTGMQVSCGWPVFAPGGDRCQSLADRALAHAVQQWGPPAQWWMVSTRAVDAAGNDVLIASGIGPPVAVIIVEIDGTFHAEEMGCFRSRPAGASFDPACP